MPHQIGGGDLDELFDAAVDIVISAQKASASLLQRKLSIGYARAAKIIDQMEMKGIVGPAEGSKPRDLLIDSLPETAKDRDFSLRSKELEAMGYEDDIDNVDSIQ